MQVKRSYCQEINDGKRTEDVAQMGIALALELVVFWRQVQSEKVLEGKYRHRKDVECMKQNFVGFIDRGNVFKQESKQVRNDEDRDPAVYGLLVVSLYVGIQ